MMTLSCNRAHLGTLVALLHAGAFVAACEGPVVPVAFSSEEQGPICAREQVAQLIARETRRHEPYGELLPGAIGERPSSDPSVVLCVATVVNRDYDYVRYSVRSLAGLPRV